MILNEIACDSQDMNKNDASSANATSCRDATFTGHTITRPRRANKMATLSQIRSIPLHSAPTGYGTEDEPGIGTGIDIDYLVARMQTQRQHEFHTAWARLMNFGTPPPPPGAETRFRGSMEDFGKLHRHGHVEYVTDELRSPTLAWVKTSTVVEVKPPEVEGGPDRLRRRFLCWNQEVTDRIHAEDRRNGGSGELHPPMLHISQYLTSFGSGATCAVVRDGKLAFWQLHLPRRARQYRRFIAPDGRLAQFCKVEMGHVDAPKIMHMLTASLAGHPDVVQYQHRSKTKVTEVWVDGYRHADTEDVVLEQTRATDELAAKVGYVLKESSVQPRDKHGSATYVSKVIPLEVSYSYDWLGVRFNHARERGEASTVRIADKTAKKILGVKIADTMAAIDIEALVGRCIWASAVVGMPLADVYDIMRYTRSICNALNKGMKAPSDHYAVPSDMQCSLRKWIATVTKKESPATARIGDRNGYMYVDATLEGWAAVFIAPRGQVSVIADAFRDGRADVIIADREGQAAAFGYRAFESKIDSECDKIDIMIDNTVAQYSFTKGSAKTEILAGAVSDMLRRVKKSRVDVAMFRVTSAANAADEGSRGRPLDNDKLRAAMEHHLASTTGPGYVRPGVAGRIPLRVA